MTKTTKSIEASTEALIQEIKQRAKLFVNDMFTNPTSTDYLFIESAMLIGASIAIDQENEGKKSKNHKTKNRLRA